MISTNSIPFITMEEHNEAFLAWHVLIREGYMPPSGNTLLHVDSHADMFACMFRNQVPEPDAGLDTIERYTYEDLNIDNFIIPAVYTGVFSSVAWINPMAGIAPEENRMYARSFRNKGKKLFIGHRAKLEEKLSGHPQRAMVSARYFEYRIHPEEAIPAGCSGVLDIDLDYFSCILNPKSVREVLVEITRNEYEAFQSNRYHPAKYALPIVHPHHDPASGKYYYQVTVRDDDREEPFKATDDQVVEKIDGFVKTLKEKAVRPFAVTFCRSRFSGYTPADQWQLIEDKLEEGLGDLFPLAKMDIHLYASI